MQNCIRKFDSIANYVRWYLSNNHFDKI